MTHAMPTIQYPWYDRRSTWLRPCRAKGITATTLDDETLLIDPVSGSTFRLNTTAAWLWDQCDGSKSLPELAAQLTEQYEVAYDDALDDLEQLVVLLTGTGLFRDICGRAA